MLRLLSALVVALRQARSVRSMLCQARRCRARLCFSKQAERSRVRFIRVRQRKARLRWSKQDWTVQVGLVQDCLGKAGTDGPGKTGKVSARLSWAKRFKAGGVLLVADRESPVQIVRARQALRGSLRSGRVEHCSFQ